MNYIKHLSAFFEKASDDIKLNPSHISLYMALFQFWNLNRFENPISINRSQTMKLCKIGSFHTYHKCLNDLHNLGYINYVPSHNPLKGSLVYLCTFDTSTEQVLHEFSGKSDTSSAQVLHPSINNINITNNKTYCEENTKTENLNPENMKTHNQSAPIVNKTKRKKVAQKKEKTMQPPELEKVITFFRLEGFSEIESRKFFNHFESNGWKVGGKSPMKNWHAAARNWMLNIQKFNPNYKGTSRHLNNTKNYGEPL